MSSAGLAKLAGSRRGFFRALRLWTGGGALFVALGLTLLAGYRPIEPRYPLQVMNIADHAPAAVPASALADIETVVARPAIDLRPTHSPKNAPAPASASRTRTAYDGSMAATTY
ncbi:MAG: hypothetical protein KJ622_04715 [Alphaproteobacteria bacterium]|nr:hypothetical protein [Alphaproteobacteria bacterium]